MLAADYRRPTYHVSFGVAIGRRIRRNYLWIITIQAGAFIGKLLVHPAALQSADEFFDRANVGPIPGEIILAMGALYVVTLAALAIWSDVHDRRKWDPQSSTGGMG